MARAVIPISRAMPRNEIAPGPSSAICLSAIVVISRVVSARSRSRRLGTLPPDALSIFPTLTGYSASVISGVS